MARQTAHRIRIPEKVLLEDFQRPLDRDLTAQFLALEKTGVAQRFEAKVLKPCSDDVKTAQLNVEGVELRSDQFPGAPKLHRIVNECARILAVPRPRVYVVNEDRLSARTVNFQEPTLVLSSTLLERRSNPRELRFIIGHEMGHIRCGHVKWHTVLRSMAEAIRSSKLIPDSLGLAPFLPVLKWAREAEMSADNAGLICSQDLAAAEQALVGLMHGAPEGRLGKINVQAFLDQSATQEVSRFAEAVQYGRESQREHPFVPARIRQLREYEKSRQYRHLWE